MNREQMRIIINGRHEEMERIKQEAENLRVRVIHLIARAATGGWTNSLLELQTIADQVLSEMNMPDQTLADLLEPTEALVPAAWMAAYPQFVVLADIYDFFMIANNDPRRAGRSFE